MARRGSRREFLRKCSVGGAGLVGVAAFPRFLLGADPRIALGYPTNETLRLGIVGVANRGADNLNGLVEAPSSGSIEIAALCDVDSGYLDEAAGRFPAAKKYRDFRKMIDELGGGGLDGVVVSTPDHVHAPASALALQANLAVYCEKPLTHSVHEARMLRELAKKAGVATQMGTQIHANANYRRVVEVVKSGAIGEVQEVHVFVGRSWAGGTRPADAPPVPANLDWELWLGPAPKRPYHSAYCPGGWRGWWDFGNGTLGDMACHHMDLPFWALELTTPATIEAEGPALDPDACPPWLIVKYDMKRRSGANVPLTWYHGEKRPRHFADGLLPEWGDGTLFVGANGLLLADYDRYVLRPEKEFAGFVPPAPSIPDSIGHYEEWIQAMKGGAPALCHFDYAAPLTEAVLLGAVAYKSGSKIRWDPTKGTTGNSATDALLRRDYRVY